MTTTADRPKAMLFAGLVDDAGLFPPEQLPMPEALARHRADQASANPVLSHRFVCPADRLAELQQHLTGDDRVAISLIVQPGSDDNTAGDARVQIASVEVPVARFAPSALDDLLTAVQKTPVYGEIALGETFADAARDLAARGMRAKLRCGGTAASAFPSTADLADATATLAEINVPFKATAGLHRAVRYTDPRTGCTHHGFLNLLVATACADDRAAAQRALECTDPEELAAAVRELDEADAKSVRTRFVSYGSCSTREPIECLAELGLLEEQ